MARIVRRYTPIARLVALATLMFASGPAAADPDTMKDPQFLAMAARSGLDVSPTGGKEIEKIIAAIETADEATVEQLGKAIAR